MPSPYFQQIIPVTHLVADGETQMAVDAALFEWVKTQEKGVLIWRTYSWKPRTWSVGCHQKLEKLSNPENTPVVRRPTGGRAILHGEDVSFAFISNSPLLLKQNVSESYCVFQTWIRQALTTLNVPLASACQTEASPTPYQNKSLCFETKTTYDLSTPTGEKISGAAQLKHRDALLQHGVVFIQQYIKTPDLLFNTALSEAITNSLPDLQTSASQHWSDLI